MLDGEWPGQGCEYCAKIEHSGGISDRNEINARANRKIIPIELFQNNQALAVSPTMVEIYFSNLCNMSCIYCGPGWSSTWEAEITRSPSKIRPFLNTQLEEQRNIKSSLPILTEKFFQWFELNASGLTNLNILGGEPFFQPETDRLLDLFDQYPCPDLTLTIFSNLKVQKAKFQKMLDRLERFVDDGKIKSLLITASLDCWGPEQEYIRYGLDLVQWEDNFGELCKRQRINIEIHGTITCLTMPTMPDLIDKINYYSDQRYSSIGYTNNFVVTPAFLSPGIFPKGFFDETFDTIISKIRDSGEKEIMIGYKKTINNSAYRPDLISELKNYLDELDAKRNTDWRKTFTLLENFKC
jgi:organic radical activating enzyme